MRDHKALVIGSTGMLGSAVLDGLLESRVKTEHASRSQGLRFDAERDSCESLIDAAGLKSGDYIVNCVGLTKKHIDKEDPSTVERSVRLNILFPLALAKAAEDFGVRIIQVATDCVFSGLKGAYSESSPHDALDVYGKSKSLGEVCLANVMHLRCSLVGPELLGRSSLFFEWVRTLRNEALIDGYVDHKWNGLTSNSFASVVAGIIVSGTFFSGVQHLVPADTLTKYDLVRMELDLLQREDVVVNKTISGSSVDRTLVTIDQSRNEMLFNLGGFKTVPTISEMMSKLPWAELRIR